MMRRAKYGRTNRRIRLLVSSVTLFAVAVVCPTPARAATAQFELRLAPGQAASVAVGQALNLEIWLTVTGAQSTPYASGVAFFLSLQASENNLVSFNLDYVDVAGFNTVLANGTDNSPTTGDFARGCSVIPTGGVLFADGVPKLLGRFSITGTAIGQVHYQFVNGGPLRPLVVHLRSADGSQSTYATVSGLPCPVITVGLPPVIADIPDASIQAGLPYTGPTPTLTQGTAPVTWSLVVGPAGMTIDANTGVVSWSGVAAVGSPHAVTVRAQNGFGSDDESWILTVLTAAADFNQDGYVDSIDLVRLQPCTTGPAIPYDPLQLFDGCIFIPDADDRISPDLDRDGDVDQEDFGIFQRCYSGTTLPDLNCAN